MATQHRPSGLTAPVAGFLSWIVPGLGHIFIGQRSRGIILLATVTLTFWTGVAIGGVRGTVDPVGHKAWFLAELCNGGNALAAVGLRTLVADDRPGADDASAPSVSAAVPGHWLAIDLGIVYAAVSGLLNILVILNAVVRAESVVPARAGVGGPVRRDRGGT